MILSVVLYDDAVLRKKARPIEQITDEILELAQDLTETMIHTNGVGLAAPQIGKLLRIFVIRDEWVGPDGEFRLGEPEVILNPQLSKPSRETISMSEGCLSLPGMYADVIRPKSFFLRWQRLDGTWHEGEVLGFRARVIMHENDHLNGVLYIDRLDLKNRNRVDPHLKKLSKKSCVKTAS